MIIITYYSFSPVQPSPVPKFPQTPNHPPTLHYFPPLSFIPWIAVQFPSRSLFGEGGVRFPDFASFLCYLLILLFFNPLASFPLALRNTVLMWYHPLSHRRAQAPLSRNSRSVYFLLRPPRLLSSFGVRLGFGSALQIPLWSLCGGRGGGEGGGEEGGGWGGVAGWWGEGPRDDAAS
jgi:hypothetical protein